MKPMISLSCLSETTITYCKVLAVLVLNLGFGDKTVNEVCEAQGVDTYTFLAIVNLVINGYKAFDDFSRLSYYLTIMHLSSCQP